MKDKKSSGNNANKTWNIVGTILLYLFLFVLIISLVFAIVARNSDRDGMEIFGHKMSIVLTGSMEKCEFTDVSGYKIKDIPVDSLIWIEAVPRDAAKAEEWYSKIRVGDVLTFKYVYVTQETITHRVVAIDKKATGGYIIKLEGDNKSSEDAALQQIIDTSDSASYNYVIGKVTGKSLFLGKLFSFISSKAGLIFIVLIPSVIIIVLEAINIYSIVISAKKDKAEKTKESQEEARGAKAESASIAVDNAPIAEGSEESVTQEVSD